MGRSLLAEELHADAVFGRLHRQRRPVLFAFWHNRIFYLSHYYGWRFHSRGLPVSVLISESSDGEVIARIAEGLGATVVRGSTTHGARQGFLGMVRRARRGDSLLITPDGPKGPRYVVQAGTALLAQKTGLPVVPISCGFSSALEFGSWDGFTVPVPGARVVVSFGEPIEVSRDADEAALEDARSAIERGLRSATEEAEQHARQRLLRVTRRG